MTKQPLSPLLALALAAGHAAGQDDGLLERVEALEEENRDLRLRVDELEGGASELQLLEDDHGSGLSVEYGDVLLSFQIHGDGRLGYTNMEAPGEGSTAFSLGSLSVLMNAQLGDYVQVFSESVVEVDSDDGGRISQERLWVSWIRDDRLYVKFGTEHAPISRYNQLYHHGRFLETAVTRPLAVRYEGDGGILPLHRTGVQVGGRRLLEAAALEYFATVSNGRGEAPTDKQRSGDANDAKAIDVGLAVEPVGTGGLRLGVALVYDEIPVDPDSMDPLRAASLREWIATLHAEWSLAGLDLRGEYAWIEHEARATGEEFSSHAGYLQAEMPGECWTPYVRLDYRDMAGGDPFYAALDRDLDAWGPVLGLRYDVNWNAAVTLEAGYLREDRRDGGGLVTEEDVATLALQVSWGL